MSKPYTTLMYESAIIGQMAERIDQMNRMYLQNYMEKKDNWFSKGLFPITERPISKPIKNGILVLGLNPMSMPDEAKKFQEILDKARENGMTPIWDGTDDIHSDQFTTYDFNLPKRSLSKSSKQGWSTYQANFNKIWEKLGYPKLKNKLYGVNWCPFPSKKGLSIPKEIKQVCNDFTKEYIRLSQPSMIITYKGVMGAIGKEVKWKHTTSSVFTKKQNFIQLGTINMGKEIPTLVMNHPSMTFVSDKSTPDTNDWMKPSVKELIDYFMSQNAIL